MTGTLSGTALVTGGGAGIGLAITRLLLERGLYVAVVDRAVLGRAQADELFGAAADRVTLFQADVRDAVAIDRLAQAVQEAHGAVDLLCNNAGTGRPKSVLWEQSAEDFDLVVGVNLLGTANVLRAFLPAMVARGSGHVLTIASYLSLGTRPGGGNAAYTASKHGVLGLCEVLADEFSVLRIPIGVTVVCPGPVDTALIKAAHAVSAAGGEYSKRLPSRAMGGLPMSSADGVAQAAIKAVERGRALEVVDGAAADHVRGQLARRLELIDAG